MSASRNADAASNQPGQIGSHIERDEPLTTHGHKPGVLVGNDAAPSFSAQTLPPGSAPADRTFAPNPTSTTPGQALNDDNDRLHGKESTKTTASSTLGGATSGDVHTGLGQPVQGQTSKEVRHDGGRGGGLAGVGSSEVGDLEGATGRDDPRQRALGKEEGGQAGERGWKREPGTNEENKLGE